MFLDREHTIQASGQSPEEDNMGTETLTPQIINQLKAQVHSSIVGLALLGVPRKFVISLLESEPEAYPEKTTPSKKRFVIEQVSTAAYSSLMAIATAGVPHDEALALVNGAWDEGNAQLKAEAAAAGK
jgi:hypothetical protein